MHWHHSKQLSNYKNFNGWVSKLFTNGVVLVTLWDVGDIDRDKDRDMLCTWFHGRMETVVHIRRKVLHF